MFPRLTPALVILDLRAIEGGELQARKEVEALGIAANTML
jgi:hypothetical protein